VVTLPGLETYSDTQLDTARGASPALARYLQLLADPSTQPLHRQRHRAWCEAVLATYFDKASAADVCAAWSATADHVVEKAWAQSGLSQLPALLVALGKHGAQELNLSSDIDLMIVAESAHAPAVEKGLRKFQSLLNHSASHGFCFRLDFDLRPGGQMAPLVTSPAKFQDHYWTQGETWERLALVRLRPLVGSSELAPQITDLARRFSFRKFLDFTLLEDLKALRAQVHSQSFVRREGEIHLKLEIGGIRDIELFVHSLLILNGGKLPELQTRSTDEAVRLLKKKNLLPADEADFLIESYWYLRHLENLVQSVDDRQTHSYSSKHESLPTARPMVEVCTRMTKIDHLVSTLLGPVDTQSTKLPQTLQQQESWLQALGYEQESISATWPQLAQATALSYKTDRDERTRQELLFRFVTEIAEHRTLDRDLALKLLLDFIRATRGKATFFAMLLRSPRLIQDLARLFCVSPYLGSIMATRPELLDHFILQVDDQWAADPQLQLEQMTERKLLTEIWSANQFLADSDLPAMFDRITKTADDISTQLTQQLKIEFDQAQFEVLALGKWGGREIGLASDLDFLFVTPGAPNQHDSKAARRFISRLTDPLKGGRLYEIDLRLRPSGQSGPLLVSRDQLLTYWEKQAQAWERQAYLRARSLAGSSYDFGLLSRRGLSAKELEELRIIREKLLTPSTAETLDLKHAPGGLIDIEFCVQTAILAKQVTVKEPVPQSTCSMIHALADADPKWKANSTRLQQIYLELRRFEQLVRLASTHKVKAFGPTQRNFLNACRLHGEDAANVWSSLIDTLSQSRQLLNELDPTGLRL
jgi:glutamate-ammonia-ligase adenylyltransferase